MLKFLVISVVATLVFGNSSFMPTDDTAANVCWKDSYGRGVGKPISACDASKGLEKSGALCYPKCKEATPSYYGIGPVCW